MRVFVVLLVLHSTAFAEVRVATHAGGGIEGAMIESPHPEGVVEVGAMVSALRPGKQWGFALAVEKIGRGYDDVENEWKVDGGFAIANRKRTFHAVIGVGVRSLTMPGNENRPDSVIRGVDLIRLDDQIQIIKRGPIALDFYFGWTFGLYHGTRYDDRIGDMVQPSRTVTSLTTAYILGLSTSVTL